MGDRDGNDERASEESAESQSGDSADDEQPVPSSTAADAKADDAGEESEPSADSDEESSSDDTDSGPPSGLGQRRRSPNEPAASGSGGTEDDREAIEDDQESDDPAAVDSDWEPPTVDRDPEAVEDDDPEDWWEDDQPGDVVDEEPTDGATPDDSAVADDAESDLDDEDSAPAARRNQMDKGGESGDDPGVKRAKGPSGKRAHAPKGGSSTPESATGASATARPKSSYDDDDVEPVTAPDDEEMPLTEHVEEMALRFLTVGIVMFGVAGIVVFYANDLINFLWYSFLGDATACPGLNCDVKPRIYHPLSLVLARLKVSTLVGLIIALPVGVYQTYRFMRPGLYPRERRYYLAAVPTSLILAVTGIGFAYFAVLPSLFSYFTEYSEQAATTAFGLTETFNLMVLMLGFFALIFQIPLLVMLAIMMGVTTRQWLEDRRLYFWAGFAGVAFLFSPDPTGMAPLIVAVTMIVLFEGTLTLLRWTGTGSPIPTAEEAAAARLKAYLVAALGGYLASSGPLPPGYYDALPAQVTEVLANAGGPIATPAIIAGLLIGIFELGALLLRRYGRSRRALKARLAVTDARLPIWLAAVVVGYFGSPEPTLVTAAQNLARPPTQAVLVGVGLLVLYELFVAVLRWREGSADGIEEPTTEEV